MGIPADPDLDRRRAVAHRHALLVLVVAAGALALFAAGAAAVVVGGLARFQTWIAGNDIRDATLWARLPVIAAAAVVLALALSALFAFRAVAFGVAGWTFRELPLRDPGPGEMTQVRNVLDALAIGLGIPPATLKVIDDDAPNALSARRRDERIICVTTGLAALPRDEIEAVCAHELLHVSAPDARVVGAAFLTAVRARNAANLLLALGVAVCAGTLGGLEYDIFLPSLFLVGVATVVVAGVSAFALKIPFESLRRQSDEVADVGAVLLARNPNALAMVLDRLARDDRRLKVTNHRCAHQWFEACDSIVVAAPGATAKVKESNKRNVADANAAINAELQRRSALATATAHGVARP
ncbi:MAG: M48 family metalloprotease [Acidimicrobiales bacterium]